MFLPGDAGSQPVRFADAHPAAAARAAAQPAPVPWTAAQLAPGGALNSPHPADPILHQAATQAIAQHYAAQSSPAALQLLHQAFAQLARANLLPTGAKFPQVMMDKANTGTGMYTTGGVVHVSPMAAQLAAQPANSSSTLSNWLREGLVHELAHSMQNQTALGASPLAEGGAQAWADHVAPTALSNWRPWGNGNYTGYVQAMAGANHANPDWLNHGQFNPINTDSPTLDHANPFQQPMANLGYLLRSAGPATPFAMQK